MAELINAERFLLFREYYDDLVGYLTAKLWSRDHAMDVAQETFLRVLTHPSSRPILQPRAFLFKTAINLSIDLFRKRQWQAEEPFNVEELQDVLTVPADQETALEEREQIQLLYKAIQELPPSVGRSLCCISKNFPRPTLPHNWGFSKAWWKNTSIRPWRTVENDLETSPDARAVTRTSDRNTGPLGDSLRMLTVWLRCASFVSALGEQFRESSQHIGPLGRLVPSHELDQCRYL